MKKDPWGHEIDEKGNLTWFLRYNGARLKMQIETANGERAVLSLPARLVFTLRYLLDAPHVSGVLPDGSLFQVNYTHDPGEGFNVGRVFSGRSRGATVIL